MNKLVVEIDFVGDPPRQEDIRAATAHIAHGFEHGPRGTSGYMGDSGYIITYRWESTSVSTR